ncbi:MAG: hypothetical protein HC802_04300 [Caldilineaceae bacterium]|nr:hypothetical protein [Caldilineaceae bacterium]
MTGPIAVLCAFGLDTVWQWRPLRGEWTRWAAVLILIGATFSTAQNYFVRWAAYPGLFYSLDVGYWQLSQAMAELPADAPVYLTPRHKPHPTLIFAPEANGRPGRSSSMDAARFRSPLARMRCRNITW